MSLDTAQLCYIGSRIGWVSALHVYYTRLPQTTVLYYPCESEREEAMYMITGVLTVNWGGQKESAIMFMVLLVVLACFKSVCTLV